MANNHNGSKRLNLDWDLIGSLAAIQCTEDEIAFVLKCHVNTLRNHCTRTQGCILGDFLEKHRGSGRASLRRKQFEGALGREGKLLTNDKGQLILDEKGRPQWEIIPLAPNPTMLIWLGKQYLAQSDKQEVASTVNGNIKLSASDLSDEELAGLIARGRSQRIAAPALGPVSSN